MRYNIHNMNERGGDTMTPYETQYKSTVMRIGLALLLFEAIFSLQTVILAVVAAVLPAFFSSSVSAVLC